MKSDQIPPQWPKDAELPIRCRHGKVFAAHIQSDYPADQDGAFFKGGNKFSAQLRDQHQTAAKYDDSGRQDDYFVSNRFHQRWLDTVSLKIATR